MTDNAVTRRTYWHRLKGHPGWAPCIVFTVGSFVSVGIGHWQNGLLAAGLMLGCMVPLILWTARHER